LAVHLQTDRLNLRDWRQDDHAPFAAMNADARVMEFFPETSRRQEFDDLAGRVKKSLTQNGFGLFAVEVRDTKEFIGFTGFSRPGFEAFFTPAIEIGWRLKHSAWGQGFATEAARACLSHGFVDLGFEDVVSFTAVSNRRSIAVMERIGMTRDPKTFNHPDIGKNHPLSPHVLYRLSSNTC